MKKKILIILAVIACIIVALVGYSAYEVHQSAQEFQKTYESKKSFERTETNEAEADGEKKAEEQSGDRPYGVLEPGGEYEVDTYIDNRDNSNRLYIYDMDYVDLALDYDDSRENPQSVYYPIYDYISKMYLDKYVTTDMSYDEAKEVMDQMLDRLLFDVSEEHRIDRDHFYTYLDDYYENNI